MNIIVKEEIINLNSIEMITIEVNNGVLEMFKDNRESSIYHIRKEWLNHTLSGSATSLWIHQLLSKKWIEKEILYELATIIQTEFPKNEINWFETFSLVERKFLQEEKRKSNIYIPETEIIDTIEFNLKQYGLNN